MIKTSSSQKTKMVWQAIKDFSLGVCCLQFYYEYANQISGALSGRPTNFWGYICALLHGSSFILSAYLDGKGVKVAMPSFMLLYIITAAFGNIFV